MQGKAEAGCGPAVHVGIDVSKAHVDVYLHPLGERLRLGNDAPGCRRLLRRLTRLPVALVVMEPTAKYHRLLHRRLAAAGLPVALVNPLRARLFAEACGQRAKSDPLDAAMLALMGERLKPDPTLPPSQAEEELAELAQARQAAVAERVALANRLNASTSPFLRRELRGKLQGVERHIERLDRQIAHGIAADPTSARRVEILRSVPGIGPRTALSLLAFLRELGQLDAKQAAALAGLAPFARDSGAASPPRYIRGGRDMVRRALYMAALVASRQNPELAAFYKSLISRGKAPKLALIAVARKLIILANRLIADNRTWQPIRP